MNQGKYVFAQIFEFVPHNDFCPVSRNMVVKAFQLLETIGKASNSFSNGLNST